MDMSTSTLPFCQLGSRLSMKKMASLRQRHDGQLIGADVVVQMT